MYNFERRRKKRVTKPKKLANRTLKPRTKPTNQRIRRTESRNPTAKKERRVKRIRKGTRGVMRTRVMKVKH